MYCTRRNPPLAEKCLTKKENYPAIYVLGIHNYNSTLPRNSITSSSATYLLLPLERKPKKLIHLNPNPTTFLQIALYHLHASLKPIPIPLRHSAQLLPDLGFIPGLLAALDIPQATEIEKLIVQLLLREFVAHFPQAVCCSPLRAEAALAVNAHLSRAIPA